jgi:hypothetical protein
VLLKGKKNQMIRSLFDGFHDPELKVKESGIKVLQVNDFGLF